MTKIIIYTNENGGVSITYPTPEFLETHTIEDVKIKDTPEHSIIIDASELPQNQDEFFNAWELNGKTVTVNVTKAKTIAHDKRRAARTEEFKPHDEIIMKQIPGADSTAAEAARAAIRTKYATMQTAINSASTVDAIKAAMPQGE
jgi:hypothetical protein